MKLSDLPAIGQPLDAGILVGLTTTSDGKHSAVVLLPDMPTGPLQWLQAMNWAASVDGTLPTRPVAAMLFANAKTHFDNDWHWTCELDGSYAWTQNFDDGSQDSSLKSYGGRARAVRLIQLTA
jgi:hypothetical protein